MNVITVIIPSYNKASIIEKAIDSIFNQSYPNVECLVIDGASSDNTLEILKRKQILKLNRMYYISEPDTGIYDAMNKGWKMANGEWIMYLGADDELEPDAIKHLVENSAGADIVYGNTTFIIGDKIKKEKSWEPAMIKKDMICSHQSLMMKKSVIAILNGFNLQYKISADFDLILRAYLQNYRFKHIPYYISRFNCNGISATSCKNIIDKFYIHRNNKTMKGCKLYFRTLKLFLIKYTKLQIKKLIKR